MPTSPSSLLRQPLRETWQWSGRDALLGRDMHSTRRDLLRHLLALGVGGGALSLQGSF